MRVFRRYKSEIHGNYRRAYLVSGLVTGGVMGAYVLGRLISGHPEGSPVSYVVSIVQLVLIFLLAAYYRNSLPDKRVTLKELMLFGMGTAVLSALVYGGVLFVVGRVSDLQTVTFTNTMTELSVTETDPQLHYWAAWWSIMGVIETAVVGGLGAFLAAILFRNENSEIINKKA